MGRYDRSIKIAFDKTSGKILEADEVFDIKTDAFEIRKKYHEKNYKILKKRSVERFFYALNFNGK